VLNFPPGRLHLECADHQLLIVVVRAYAIEDDDTLPARLPLTLTLAVNFSPMGTGLRK
jgi:hypothetical protein